MIDIICNYNAILSRFFHRIFLVFFCDNKYTLALINVYTFFEMMAEELAADPKDAELIVTNQPIIAPEGAEVIREYDFERMIALMNK